MGIGSNRGFESVTYGLCVVWVLEPREVGVDQDPGGCPCRVCQRDRASKIRLELRFDGTGCIPSGATDRLRVLNDLAGHVDRRLERPSKSLVVLQPGGLDDARERDGIALDEPDTRVPDPPKPSRGLGMRQELLKQGGSQRRAERGHAATPDPGPPTGDLF